MWESIKWFAAACFIAAVVLLFSPKIAATAITPWILYIIGNGIWAIDAYRGKNIPWMVLAFVFIAIDALILYARLFNLEILDYIKPFIHFFEIIP